MRLKPYILCLMLLALFASNTTAQSPSTQGTDFWLTYLFNYEQYSDLKLIITGQRACRGTASNPKTGWSYNFTVYPGVVTNLIVPYEQAYNTDVGTFNTAIHVVTTDTVSVYASNYYPASFDVSNVLPTSTLRDSYIVQTYPDNDWTWSLFAIVATEDNTIIDIVPTAVPADRYNANAYTVTLDRGEVYHTGAYGSPSMSGTLIEARNCKPIAVFVGSSVANVPLDVCCGDHLVEQLMPTNYHGSHFVITPSELREEDRIIITASEANCQVRANGRLIATLGAYQSQEFSVYNADGAIYLETSTPAQVYLYFTGGSNDELTLGDPSMVLINPIEQQINKITFGTFQTELTDYHFVNVVATTSSLPTMTLDGQNISSEFQPVRGNPDYSYAQIQINYGSHTLETSTGGFVAHVYGLGGYESYSYTVGSNAIDLASQMYINNATASFLTPTEVCQGDELDLRVVSDLPIASVKWDFGDGQNSSGITTTHAYSSTGTFDIRTTIATTLGRCDTRTDTIPARIVVNPTPEHTEIAQHCQGDNIVWNGQRLTRSDTYTKHITSTHGCDSLDQIILTINPTSDTSVTETIVQSALPRHFAGYTFRRATDTTLHLRNHYGCDSLVHYSLNVNANTSSVIDTAICQGQLPLTWNGQRFTSAGTKQATLRNHLGADSIVTMTVSLLPPTYASDHHTVIENNLPYRYHSHTFTTDVADSTIRLTTTLGCDSLVSFSLTVLRNTTTSLSRTACPSELPLEWQGLTFTSATTKTKTLTSSRGTDSTLRLTLTLLRNSTSTRHDTIVENSLPYSFANLSFRAAQRDTVIVRTNAAGCDSLITFSLHVWQNRATTADSSICEGQLPFTWNGTRFTAASTKKATLHARHGEDSVVTMRLNVRRNSNATRRDTIVENALPHRFAGLTFRTSQPDTLIIRQNAAGCDSIITYALFVYPNRSTTLDTALCPDQVPFVWNQQTFTTTATKSTTLTAHHGEDSVITMRFTLLSNTSTTHRDTIVENSLPHHFASLTFNASQTDTLIVRRNSQGCDSLITYALHVWPNKATTADSSICENLLPFTWNNKTFTAAGTKKTTLHTSHGADSVVTMRLDVRHNSTYAQRDTIIENSLPHRFAGVTFRASQADTLLVRQNVAGCDSLITYGLHVWQNLNTMLDSSVCEGQLPIEWNGETFNAADRRQILLAGQHGEDSTVSMTIAVRRNTRTFVRDTVVENQLPVRFANLTFDGPHADTLIVRQNAAGCDSLITFSLFVYGNVYDTADLTICENSLPYTWNGVTFDDEGSQSVKLRAAHNEDSNLLMRLHVLRNTRHTIVDTTIENALPYRIAGLALRQSVVDTLIVRRNAAGCDSLITLSLHVHFNTHMYYDTAICDNFLPLTWFDSTFTRAETKTIVHRMSTGADSIEIITLTVHPTYDLSITPAICSASYYRVGDSLLSLAGHHDIMLHSRHSCDSLIHVLLTVYDTFFHLEIDTICDNMTRLFDGMRYNTPGTYTNRYLTRDGCDSILQLKLYNKPTYTDTDNVAICHGQSYTWGNGITYRHTTHEPIQHHQAHNLCDSVRHLHLTVDRPILAAIHASPSVVEEPGQTVFIADASANTAHSEWLLSDGTTGNTPTLAYSYPSGTDSIVVQLIATSALGCSDTAYTTLRSAQMPIWAPNVFTPTLTDNNRFCVATPSALASFTLHIYNRQGLQVFATTDPTACWDGTHRGSPCPQGNYIYTIHYSSPLQPKLVKTITGSVLLLK